MEKNTDQKLAEDMSVQALKLGLLMDAGKHYLMSVQPENLTVEDALEAFGFGRNGLKNPIFDED